MKNSLINHYKIYHDGLTYTVDEYASSKRKAIENYRNRWNLEGKRINLICYKA